MTWWSIDNDYHQDILLHSFIFVNEKEQKDFFGTPKKSFATDSLVKKKLYLQIDISNC